MTLALHAAVVLVHPSIEDGDSWNDSIFRFVISTSKEELKKCCVTWYGMWSERNKVWQHSQARSPHEVGWIATSNLVSYHHTFNEK